MKRLLALSLLIVAVAGCEPRLTEPGPAASTGEFAKKGATSAAVPHTIQFSGDIVSGPISVMASSASPLTGVVSSVTPITLPDLPDLAGCGIGGGNWGGYSGNWTGYLALSGDGRTSTLNYTAYASDGTPFWLSVKGATTTQQVGTSTVLAFTNVTAMAKMDRDPLVIILPCASFHITATRL
jgi:hypothetical protein